MTIEVTRLPDEPVIIYTYPEYIRSEQEVRDALNAASSYKMGHGSDIYIVHDASRLKLDFSQMLTTLATLVRETPNPQDLPRMRFYAVGSDEMVRRAAMYTAQDQYGNLDVSMVDTLDAALDDIHTRMGEAG